MFKIGDKVSVLDDAIDGVVLKINQNQIIITTNEGFELNFTPKELILLESSSDLMKNFSTTNFSSVKKEKEESEAHYCVCHWGVHGSIKQRGHG